VFDKSSILVYNAGNKNQADMLNVKFIIVVKFLFPLDREKREVLKGVEQLDQAAADMIYDQLISKVPIRLRSNGRIFSEAGKVLPEKWTFELEIVNNEDGKAVQGEDFKALLQKTLDTKLDARA
jgi:hypothetical protein